MAADLTDFQKKKILRVFNMLYDRNHDGVIESSDFDLLLKKICEILEWNAGGPKYQQAKQTLDIVWAGLLKYADTDEDAKITQEEWLKMWGECLKTLEQGTFPDWQKKYMDLMFDVNDKSGDDCIDENEYTTFMSEFKISASDCKKAFQAISGADRKITRDQFATLWKDYLTSNDTSSPGNYLFGLDLDS